MKKIIWQYWEGPKNDFISLCMETVKKNSLNFEVIDVNEKTLYDFLPDIRKDLDLLPRIANKADYIRFSLLNQYGGIWLDSDTVLLKDLEDLWNEMILKNKCFSATSHFGPGKPSIWFLMSRSNSIITKKYLEKANHILDKEEVSKIPWNGLGMDILWNFTNPNNYLHLDVEKFCPIPYNHYKMYFKNIPIKEVLSDDSYCFVFFNEMLNRHEKQFINKKKEEILKEDNLISKILRKAIYE